MAITDKNGTLFLSGRKTSEEILVLGNLQSKSLTQYPTHHSERGIYGPCFYDIITLRVLWHKARLLYSLSFWIYGRISLSTRLESQPY